MAAMSKTNTLKKNKVKQRRKGKGGLERGREGGERE